MNDLVTSLTIIKAWRLAAILFFLALGFAIYLDRPIIEYLMSSDLQNRHPSFSIGRKLGRGEQPVLAVAMIWGTVFFAYMVLKRNLLHAWKASLPVGRKALLIVTCLVASGLIANIIKFLLGRPRPLYAFEHDVFGLQFFETGGALHSFPSGHTTTQVSVILALMLFFPRLSGFFLLIAAFWLACNSIVLAHWPSDIFGGIALTVLCFAYIRRFLPALH